MVFQISSREGCGIIYYIINLWDLAIYFKLYGNLITLWGPPDGNKFTSELKPSLSR
jgi:hypothetical protein